MASGPEATLVAKIKKAVSERYPEALVYKNHGNQFSAAGLPDLTIVLNGAAVYFEVKAAKPSESSAAVMSRVTPIQTDFIYRLRKAGAVAEVVWEVDQALDYLGSMLPVADRADASRDARLYALAASEDALRASNEHLEAELQALRVENDRLRTGALSPHANFK